MTGVVVDNTENLALQARKQADMLNAYRQCMNSIDDYLEYRRESEKDAIHILAMIDKLTGTLRAMGG